jgi:hypothetical protein
MVKEICSLSGSYVTVSVLDSEEMKAANALTEEAQGAEGTDLGEENDKDEIPEGKGDDDESKKTSGDDDKKEGGEDELLNEGEEGIKVLFNTRTDDTTFMLYA